MGVAGLRRALWPVSTTATARLNISATACPAPGTSSESAITLSRLDARDPYVVDTRQLGRQPGSMRTVNRIVAVPETLETAMASVPKGQEIELDLRLEAVMEGVLVTGTVQGRLTAECSRCLDPLSEELEAGFQEMYRYPDDESSSSGSDEDADDEDEDYYLEGELLDLEPVVRDAVVLALPLSPLCVPDCPGLCSECGVKMAEAGPDHGHGDGVDPRWEALRRIAEDPGK